MPAPDLTFDPATHEYRVGGVVVPSVTQLLMAAGYYSPFATNGDPYYADLGRRVHAMCARIDLRTPMGDEKFDVQPYADAYREFIRTHHPSWTAVEQLGYHTALRYAGTVDRIGFLNGAVVLDIKTGQPSDSDGLQLAGYDLLFPYITRRRRVCLYLTGQKYSLETYANPADYNTFIKIVRDHHSQETTA